MKNILFCILFQLLYQYAYSQWALPTYGTVTRELNVGSVFITDDGGAGNYSGGIDGGLIIKPHPDSIIQLSFEEFNLGGGARLEIIERVTLNWYQNPKIDLIGNEVPGNYYSMYPGRSIELRFSTSYYYPTTSGFKVKAELKAVSQVPPADLSVKGLLVKSEKISSGGDLKVELTCSNKGGRCEPVVLGFFLSTDTLKSSSDIPIGTYTADTLVSLKKKTMEAWGKISHIVAEGWYYLVVQADPDGLITEQNENDNVVWKKVYVKQGRCDVFPSALYTNNSQSYSAQTVTRDQLFKLSAYIKNEGNCHLQRVFAECYFSNDHILDPSDSLLCSIQVKDILAGGSSFNEIHGLRIPDDISPGSKYIIVKVDPANDLVEWNESNNTIAYKVIVKDTELDYEISFSSNTNIPFTSLYKGRSQAFGYNVRVPYNSVVSFVNTAVFFSSDAIYDSTDLLIQQKSDTLEWYYFNSVFYLTFPSTFPYSSGWLHFVTDHDRQLTEADESNNVASLAIALIDSSSADLVATSISNSEIVFPGQEFTCYLNYRNDGSYPSQTAYGRLVLSTDSIADSSDDLLMDSIAFPSLIPGSSNSKYLYPRIPDSLAAGSYFLVYELDHQNILIEESEENNVLKTILVVGADQRDLEVTDIVLYNGDTLKYDRPCSISASFRSKSNSVLTNIYSRLLLSKDPFLDHTDILLQSSYHDSLEKFSGFGILYNDTIQNLPSGTHYLIFETDVNDLVSETDESNNQLVKRIFIGSTADIPIISIPGSGSVQISGCDQRIFDSGGASDNYPDNSDGTLILVPPIGKYIQLQPKYLSCFNTDDRLDIYDGMTENDDQVGSFFFAPSMISATSNSGAFRLKFHSDASGNKEGLYFISSCVSDPFPDLVNLRIEGPSYAIPGQSISIHSFIENRSDRHLEESIWAIYLSSDSIFDSSDRRLSVKTISSLFSFSRAMNFDSFRMDDTLSLGSYYLISVLDLPGLIAEKSENNNIVTKKITFKKQTQDFWIGALNATPLPDKGLRIEFGLGHNYWTNSDSVLVELYLSNDHQIDFSDQVLINEYFSLNDYRNLNLDSSDLLLNGNLFVLTRVDGGSKVTEQSESNNYGTVPIMIADYKPDLAVSGGIFPSIGTVFPTKSYVDIRFRLRNSGQSTTNSFRVGVYLSQDSLYNPGDYLINQQNFTWGIYTGQSLEHSVNHYFSYLHPPGKYYILVAIDEANTVQESDESNNVFSVEIRLLPERHDFLMTSAFVGSQQGVPNQSLSYYCSAYDKEAYQSSSFYVASYLSKDSILDSLDITYGSWYLNSSQQLQSSFFLPADTGWMYAIFKVDPSDQFLEPNESDNTLFVPFHISEYTRDIYFAEADLKRDSLAIGGSPNIGYRVSDIIPVTYIDTTMLFLSSDPVLDQSDISLGNQIRSHWNNSSYYWTYSFNPIPAGVNPGAYYLFLKADGPDAYKEASELNNLVMIPLMIVPVSANIKLSSFKSLWDSIVVGNNLQLVFNLSNTGNTDQIDTCWFYLSSDSLWDPTDSIVGFHRYSLVPGQSYNGSYTLYSSSYPSGVSYIIAITDRDSRITENNEADNSLLFRIKVMSPFIDLSVSSSSISPNALAGAQQYNYWVNVSNSGNRYSGLSHCDLWLSSDSLFSSDDLLIDQADCSNVGAGSQSNVQFQFHLSNLPGKYLISRIDITDTISETNEQNNLGVEFFNPLTGLSDLSCYLFNNYNLDSITVEEAFNLEYRVKNYGMSGAGSSASQIYLSEDQYLQFNDILLGSVAVDPIARYQSFEIDTSVVVQSSVSEGWKKIFFVSDSENSIVEQNEGNNVSSQFIYVLNPTGITGNRIRGDLLIHPNPSSDKVYISGFSAEELKIQVFSIDGRLILSEISTRSTNVVIDVSNFSSGTYIVKINGQQNLLTGKFIKM